MISKVVLYAEDKLSNMIYGFFTDSTKEFNKVYKADSYKNSLKKAIEHNADIIIIQLFHPVYKIHNFFHELRASNCSPVLLIFNVLSENQIVYSITNHKNRAYINKIKLSFSEALIRNYNCYLSDIGEGKDSNLIMESRIKKLAKNEYLNEILRGVTYNEFINYKLKANLKLNYSGFYLYIWDFMDIEYTDHDLNKYNYFFVGEEFLKECQSVLDNYNGGEAFYINPLLLCIIINDFNLAGQASKQRRLLEITNELNNVTNSKSAFRYMSGYIKNVENIRGAYEAFHHLKIYNFFCRDSKLLTQEHINSIKKESNLALIDTTLKEIKKLINYDIFNPKLNDFIKKLFLEIIKPSLDYNLYYYCYTLLSSTLMEKYTGIYNKMVTENAPPSELIFSSIEDKCSEFIESINLLRAKLSGKYTVKNLIVFQAVEFIHSHYMDDITVNQIASKLNISASYLSQIFKNEFGTNIIKYIINYRIERAKELLSSGDQLICNISAKVGFFDEKHFSKTFKKATGLTPMQYKKQNKKVEYV